MPDHESAPAENDIRGCYRYEFTGAAVGAEAPMDVRRDPMLSFAMTVLAANKQARVSGQRASFGRIEVEPNRVGGVPERVTAWLDVRAEDEAGRDALHATVLRLATERAARDRTHVEAVQVEPDALDEV